MSLLKRIREWADSLFDEDVVTDDFDEEYLRQRRLAYIETAPDCHPDMIRCDLCGRLFDTMDDCVKHVADHDDQGSASVDPFRASRSRDSKEYQTDEPYNRAKPDPSDGPGTDSEEEAKR